MHLFCAQSRASRGFPTCRVSSELSERSKQLQSAQTDAQQMFEQSKVQHADLLNQIQRAQLATQQAIDAQIEAEQQLQNTQQASAQQLSQVTADIDQQVHAAKHSAYEESGEKLQILQQECEDQVAAARSEAQQLETEHQERLQQLHQQLEIEQQNCLNRQQQQLETAHLESLKQLQQQLQSCQQDCESLQAEKLVLEQQVQSAKADSARELQELRDSIKSAVAAQMRQHSLKLGDEKSAHKKATGRHQIDVAELQAALERQQEDSMRREHQMLQGHMAGLAAKDIMVQQMWSELHDSKQGSRRYAFQYFRHLRTVLRQSPHLKTIHSAHPLLSTEHLPIISMYHLDIKSQLLHVCCNQDTSWHIITTGLCGLVLALRH